MSSFNLDKYQSGVGGEIRVNDFQSLGKSVDRDFVNQINSMNVQSPMAQLKPAFRSNGY